MNIRGALKAITPPVVVSLLRQSKREAAPRYGFFGDYPDYATAAADCHSGYEDPTVMDITARNTRAARDGGPDDLFVHPIVSTYLAAMQSAVAAVEKSTVKVLDFGGAMGAHYFRLRRCLPQSIRLDYTVAELPATMAASAEFANDELRFSSEWPSDPDIVLASGVFQCLPKPYETLHQLLALPASRFVLPLIPLTDSHRDRLTVQRVDPVVFNAAYPHWFFSRSRFEQEIARSGLTLVSRWREPEYTNLVDRTHQPYFGLHLSK